MIRAAILKAVIYTTKDTKFKKDFIEFFFVFFVIFVVIFCFWFQPFRIGTRIAKPTIFSNLLFAALTIKTVA